MFELSLQVESSKLLLESAKFTLDMTSPIQQGSCWKDPARVEFTIMRGFRGNFCYVRQS